MNKSNHFIAPHLLNPVDIDGIGISEMQFRKSAPPAHKDFRLKLIDWAEEQEVGR